MDFLLAYIAGLLTLINPCVLPVLPIVLGSALQASPRGPLALAAGMGLSFVVLGVLVSAFGYAIGLDEERVAMAGAALMVVFGVVLLVPRFASAFQSATAGVSSGADAQFARFGPEGTRGQFLGGLLLGAVWSPCIGPTLGGAIALAASGQGLGRAALIMICFALGTGTLVLGFGYGARGLMRRHQGALQRLSRAARPALGVIFLLTGLAILFHLPRQIDAWLLQHLPPWLIDLSVRY